MDLQHIFPPCIIHRLTGFYCPGCGATRSVLSLLSGHPWRSFFYYPAVPVAAVLLLWLLVSAVAEKLLRRKVFFHFPMHRAWLYLLLGLVVFNFLWKNGVLLITGTALMG